MDNQVIEQVKQGDLNAALQIYNENRGFIQHLGRNVFYVAEQNLNDFEQLAFLAILETAQAYKIGYAEVSTFKALWKKYILKEYFDFRLETQMTMRVSRSTYTKLKATTGINNSLLQPVKYELDTVKGSNLFIEIEREMLNDTLWQLVRESLNYRDYQILYRYYKKEQNLKQIANDFNLTSEAIRKRKIRSLQKLKENKYLQILAADYYGLQREVV